MGNSIQIKDIFNNIKLRYKKMRIYSLVILIITIILFVLTINFGSYSEYIFIGKEDNIDVEYSYNDGKWYEQLRKEAYDMLTNNEFLQKSFERKEVKYNKIFNYIKVIPKNDVRVLEVRGIGFNIDNRKEIVSTIINEFISEYNYKMKDIKAKKINNYYEEKIYANTNNSYILIIGLIILFIGNLVIVLKQGEDNEENFKG